MSATPQRAVPAPPDIPHPPGAIIPTDYELVGVLVEQEQRRLIAVRPIRAGTAIFQLEGRETAIPTRYSVQIGRDVHLDPDDVTYPMDRVRSRSWMYLNHHCEPSAWIHDRVLLALRDIEPGDGVTFDYNTTEWDMASPFDCHCGSAHCVGRVRGAKHLTPAQRSRVERWIAGYLR